MSHDAKEFEVPRWQISLSGTESVKCGGHVTDRTAVIRGSYINQKSYLQTFCAINYNF